MDFGQRVGVEVDFDDGIGVDTVYLAVGPLTDHLAVLNGNHAIGLVHLHHLGEARHLEDIVKIRVDVR